MFESATPPPPKFRPRFRLPSFGFRGTKLGSRLLRLALLIVPIIFFRACFLTDVPPDRIGLRQISYGPGRGLQKELVHPGYRRELFSYETVRTFPRNVQAIEFTNDPTERGTDHLTRPAVNVPTVDGYPITVDVTILYSVIDPFLVVSRFGFGRGYEENVVIRFTDPAIKQHLGELRAEEFYSLRRDAQVYDAQKDFYERSKHAEADLLVKSAEAGGTEQINKAMEGAGSDKLLRLRRGLALLNSIKGPIYINEDPTDLVRAGGH